ncbi:MAG: tripartite tricarboxylate transporter TctB family protein [Pseudomonadota bacterium]
MGGLTQSRLGGLVFLVLSVLFGWQALGIATLPIDAEESMSARTLPLFLAVAGVVLALLQILRGGPGTDTAAVSARDAWLAGALLALIVLYALALPRIGFGMATLLFLLASFRLLGERRPGLTVGVALATSLIFTFLLRVALGVYLAPGAWWVALGLAHV